MLLRFKFVLFVCLFFTRFPVACSGESNCEQIYNNELNSVLNTAKASEAVEKRRQSIKSTVKLTAIFIKFYRTRLD